MPLGVLEEAQAAIAALIEKRAGAGKGRPSGATSPSQPMVSGASAIGDAP